MRFNEKTFADSQQSRELNPRSGVHDSKCIGWNFHLAEYYFRWEWMLFKMMEAIDNFRISPEYYRQLFLKFRAIYLRN